MDKFFKYAYCNTVHSMQGSTVDEAITIFNWKCKYVSAEWLYVAITGVLVYLMISPYYV